MSTTTDELYANLEGRFKGPLLRPTDEGYDDARGVWNGMIDRKPALIAQCTDVADVIDAVNVAREAGVAVAIRGGAHQVAGSAVCDDGLVIDLTPMKGVHVDPKRRTVRAEGGVIFAELDRETQVHGLATPGGVVSDTGIAGLTLGGGIGWLRRKVGLTSDNLIGATVVTASGEVVVASEEENPELLWGLRGGGGNFGVVTSFEYRLHDVGPEVYFAAVFHDGERTNEALRFYDDWCASAPEEVTSFAICGTVLPEDPFPKEAHGKPMVLFAACWSGEIADAEEAVRPLREFSQPIVDLSGRMPYVEVQSFFDEDYPSGELRYYWKSLYLDRLSDEAIDCIAKFSASRPSPLSTVDIWQMGGAVRNRAEEDSAFAGRDAAHILGVEANWESADDDEANIAWARDLVEAMKEFSSGGEYFNFPGLLEGGSEAFAASLGSEKYARLVALKDEYDPTNLFRLNQNIQPSAAGLGA